MNPFTLFIIAVSVVLILILGVFLVWGLKQAVKLLINSVIGFFALWLTKVIFLSALVINVWSVLIVAFFGIVGYFVVLAGHFLGIF